MFLIDVTLNSGIAFLVSVRVRVLASGADRRLEHVCSETLRPDARRRGDEPNRSAQQRR